MRIIIKYPFKKLVYNNIIYNKNISNLSNMKNLKFRDILPHIVAIIVFLVISFSYFSPILEGKVMKQSDIMNYEGASKEITDYRDATGEEALWTNSMFSGMPAYLISIVYPVNAINYIHKIINLNFNKPANYIFVCLLGFYISLLVFRVNPWLSIAGSIAFAFSSYIFIIIGAGHLTKAQAIGYMSPIIAGTYLAFNRKMLLGSAIAGIFLALQLLTNHYQITFYTLLIILTFIIFQFIISIKQKEIKNFTLTSGLLIIISILAIGSNFASIWLTYDYGKDSMRGKSELTSDKKNKTSGLDKDYITAWSYGISETMTLLIPNFKGGGADDSYEKTDFYKEYEPQIESQYIEQGYSKKDAKQSAGMTIGSLFYWGAQPFTSGPVYVGAIMCFLFVFGLFVVKGHIKWWLLTATVLSILLAWGHNFMFFTNIFLDYFPGYDKFRTVSMILVIAEFTIPLLAIIALNKVFNEELSREKFLKSLKLSLYIVGGITLIFAILPGMFFDFSGNIDAQLSKSGWPLDKIIEQRENLLQTDAFRSLIFILITAALMLVVYLKKIDKNLGFFIFILLVLFDMWPIDKRYINNNNFVSKQEAKVAFAPSQANLAILQDKDPDFRVLNLAVNTFNDASTAYYHKSIGGYHGAKMKRYQELIDYHIKNNNLAVLNMLNTKYIIVPTKDRGDVPQINPDALGNAWFVNKYKIVPNADEEIKALTNFEPKEEAIVDKRFESQLKGISLKKDTTSTIKLIKYKPNYLEYKSSSKNENLAVFSEIYYNKGWNAFIDNKPVDHFRANYVLRAMLIPAGNHDIVFKFEPKMYYTGNKISLISSLILILFLITSLLFETKILKFKK